MFSLFTINKARICANLLTARANQQELINPWIENRAGITYTGKTGPKRETNLGSKQQQEEGVDDLAAVDHVQHGRAATASERPAKPGAHTS